MSTIRAFGRTFTRASEDDSYQTDLGYEPYIVIHDLDSEPDTRWHISVALKGHHCEAEGPALEEVEAKIKQKLIQRIAGDQALLTGLVRESL